MALCAVLFLTLGIVVLHVEAAKGDAATETRADKVFAKIVAKMFNGRYISGVNTSTPTVKNDQGSVRFRMHQYSLVPEPMGRAYFDRPSEVNTQGYNMSCLEDWGEALNASLTRCYSIKGNFTKKVLTLIHEACDNATAEPQWSCTSKKSSSLMFECSDRISTFPEGLDAVTFKDGRKPRWIAWNCGDLQQCNYKNLACKDLPIYQIQTIQYTTAPSPSFWTRLQQSFLFLFIFSLALSIIAIRVCLRCYWSTRIRTGPIVNDELKIISFPPPTMAGDGYRMQRDACMHSFPAPSIPPATTMPPVMPPPPAYSECVGKEGLTVKMALEEKERRSSLTPVS